MMAVTIPANFLVQPERTVLTGPRWRASKGGQRAGVETLCARRWLEARYGDRPGSCVCVCVCVYTQHKAPFTGTL